MKQLWPLAAILVAVLAVIAVVALRGRHDEFVRVERVSDGDTIVVDGGTRVRLVQIDTPEVFGEPECYG